MRFFWVGCGPAAMAPSGSDRENEVGSPKRAEFMWSAVPGFPSLFRCDGAAYWKGGKGWWADQGDGVNHGPFRGPRLAQSCAEEQLRAKQAEREAKAQLRAEQKTARQAAREDEKARETWGTVSAADRRLAPGQRWSMKQLYLESNEILILEVRKKTVVVLARADGRPWSRAERDTRSLGTVPRLYRLLGTARIPKRFLQPET